MTQTVLDNPSFEAGMQTTDLYRMQVRELRHYAMFMIDPEGILTSWNAGVEQLLGYSEQEWIGQLASMIFTPEEMAVEVCESEMRLARKTGNAGRHPMAPPQKRNGLFRERCHERRTRRAGRTHRIRQDPERRNGTQAVAGRVV